MNAPTLGSIPSTGRTNQALSASDTKILPTYTNWIGRKRKKDCNVGIDDIDDNVDDDVKE